MIHREDRDGIAVLRIEHGKANTLDMELCDAVVEAFEDANDARAVVLTGTGRIFSAGVDLFRVLEGGASYVDAFVPAMCRAFERLFVHPAPVAAAANGHAIAGGCLLVAAADQRLMAAGSARIGIPELQVGVPFPPWRSRSCALRLRPDISRPSSTARRRTSRPPRSRSG